MLCDVKLKKETDPLCALIAKGAQTTRHSQGIYLCGHWNFGLEFSSDRDFDLDYPDLGSINCFGVCDSPEQLRTVLPEHVKTGPEKFVVSMVRIRKADQPDNYGWRWCKWGPYVGLQNPTCEYLADEPDIDEVYTFQVHKLRDEEALPA